MQMAKRQQMTKAAETAVQKTAQAAGRALRSIIAAAQSLLAAIAAGGSTVVAMVLVICLIGLLIVSPFGIFFSGEDSGTGYTMPEAVSVLNGEFAARIEQIKAENPHDELDMDNAGSAAMISNWRDVLAVYAVRTTTDNASPDEVATLTEEKMEILREIFWDMNAITYWTEIVPGGKDEADTVILHITVTIKTHLQMADEYRFNTEQRRLLEELMQPKYQELFMALTGSYQDIESRRGGKDHRKSPRRSQRESQASSSDGVSTLGQSPLFLGRKVIDYWLGQPLGNADESYSRGQFHHWHRAALRTGLFGNGGLGILQPERRTIRHWAWRRGHRTAHLLCAYCLG